MRVAIGTADGVLTDDLGDEREPTVRLADAPVRQLRWSPDGSLYAATTTGLYRSRDGGSTWSNLGVPHDHVASTYETPDGGVSFAGTKPAGLYRSTDDGESWERCESFERLPGKDEWLQLGPGGPQVRDIVGHARAPGTAFVAVEAEGVLATTDYGDTWAYRSDGLHRDPHALLALDQGALVAACGRGLYRTDDGGRSWRRLDTAPALFWHTYYREAVAADGVLYASAQDRSEARHDPPGSGVIVESSDGGSTLEVVSSFPGADGDFVNAWAAADGTVVGGTLGGRVLVERDDWEVAATVDGEIRSLAAVDGGGET